MKQAYLITFYKDPVLLTEMILALDSGEDRFFVHVDRKFKGEVENSLLEPIKSRIHFVPSVKVEWGGYSHLNAILRLLRTAFKSDTFDYYHLMSAQCYPVTTAAQRNRFLVNNTPKSFIHFELMDKLNWSGGSFNRLKLYHLNDCFDIRLPIPSRINGYSLLFQKKLRISRRLPTEIRNFYGGSTWWSLHHKAVSEVFSFLNSNTRFEKRFRFTHCPEEYFFQSILLNSSVKDTLVSDDLRFISWTKKHNSIPAILDEADAHDILTSGKLFMRKIEKGTSDRLIDAVRYESYSKIE